MNRSTFGDATHLRVVKGGARVTLTQGDRA